MLPHLRDVIAGSGTPGSTTPVGRSWWSGALAGAGLAVAVLHRRGGLRQHRR
jgi:hypothetical protein